MGNAVLGGRSADDARAAKSVRIQRSLLVVLQTKYIEWRQQRDTLNDEIKHIARTQYNNDLVAMQRSGLHGNLYRREMFAANRVIEIVQEMQQIEDEMKHSAAATPSQYENNEKHKRQ